MMKMIVNSFVLRTNQMEKIKQKISSL